MILVLIGNYLVILVGARLYIKANDVYFTGLRNDLEFDCKDPMVVEYIAFTALFVHYFTYGNFLRIFVASQPCNWISSHSLGGQTVEIEAIAHTQTNLLPNLIVLLVSERSGAWLGIDLVLTDLVLEE